ncbi:helicase-related protein [Candidatus Poseidoniaceae archaeon]|nr:helicase-related protein [Candidatus Poseidoniaceae archaeon]
MLDVRRLSEKMNKKTDDFIVGSKVSDGLDKNTTYEFLRRKCQSINQLDIATGYFEFSALNYLGTEVWSGIDKIRILIGNGASAGARNAIVEHQERKVKEIIDRIGGDAKESESGKAIHRAFQENRIEFKMFDSATLFHPKLYLLNPKSGSPDSKIALVGSSNFTAPGIGLNVELNVRIEEESKVDKLQLWFNHAWERGTNITKVIKDDLPSEWTTSEWLPYPIYVKAMAEFFGSNQTLTGIDWYESDKSIATPLGQIDSKYSQMWPILDQYQKEAFKDLSRIADNWKGAFLCDGVGLGKTYTGLMLIEKFTLYDNKRVLLISPKSIHDTVWAKKLQTMLKHVPKDKIESIKTTDLTSFDETKIASFSDVEMIIIDEGHHFRNPNSQRYSQLEKIIQKGLDKQVFFLTATPINNDVYDLYNMIRLFTKGDSSTRARHFRTAGVPNLEGHFKLMRQDINQGKKMGNDKIVRELIVQRSRSYVKQSMIIEKRDTAFPAPAPPKSITFKPSEKFLALLQELENAFNANKKKGKESLLNFSIYNPHAHFTGPVEDNDVHKGSLVGLIGSGLLKRLESSTKSFHMSCYKLLLKNLAWLEKYDSAKDGKKALENWRSKNSEVLEIPSLPLIETNEDDTDSLDSETNNFGLNEWDENLFDIKGIVKDIYEDINVIAKFISLINDMNPESDKKIEALAQVLNSEDMSVSGKVLIFTEYVSTAEFLKTELDRRIKGKVISVIHSNTNEDRENVITRFSPYYNESSPQTLSCSCDGNAYDANGQLHPEGCHPEEEIDILISTDVLAEGLNLQDSVRLINFDLPWNPVRLMQRIGRIDRRLNPVIERQIKGNHPEREADRGHIAYWNCLPPAEMERIIGLQKVVEKKFKIIAAILGVEGGFGLTKSQNLEKLHDLYTNSNLSTGLSNLTDTLDPLRLEYNVMLQNDTNLISSPLLTGFGTDAPHSDKNGDGKYAFFCYQIPREFDGKWTYARGNCQWYLYNFENSTILHKRSEMNDIFNVLKTVTDERRVTNISVDELKIADKTVKKFIKNSIMKEMTMTQENKPRLLCSMTIGGNENE